MTTRTFQITDGGGGIVAGGGAMDATSELVQTFLLSVSDTVNNAPKYWSHARDEWLNNFWRTPGNDILAGAVSTLTAKATTASWYIEGPMAIAMMYRDILLVQSEWGAGWEAMASKWVQATLCRDGGGLVERMRSSPTDRVGPALGFAHIDESLCIPTRNPEYPIAYNRDGKLVPIHAANIMQLLDMPSGQDKMRGIGFCAVSRAITTALVLMDIVTYKRQRLSNLPPAGLLIINNMVRTQWEDLQKRYAAEQRNQGNTIWQDLVVAFGYDPAYKLEVEMIEFSRLPEHFDERTATEIAVYTFALALRVDPRELWPVSAGVLGGTAREVEIQHRKAKAKGEGSIFGAIERCMNSPLTLPTDVKFRFDFIDDEEDALAAEIAHTKIQNVRAMWESSPNRGEPEGIISTDEARKLLVRWNVIPPDVVGQSMDVGRVYDTKTYGPRIRAYRNGGVQCL